MLIRNVSRVQLETAAAAANVQLTDVRPDGRGYRLKVRPIGPTMRRSVSPWHQDRKVSAACWHQYGRLMRRVFDLAPDAIIRSGLHGDIVYRGVGDFNVAADSTGDTNVGSMAYPVAYRDACVCEQDDYDAANDWVTVS